MTAVQDCFITQQSRINPHLNQDASNPINRLKIHPTARTTQFRSQCASGWTRRPTSADPCHTFFSAPRPFCSTSNAVALRAPRRCTTARASVRS